VYVLLAGLAVPCGSGQPARSSTFALPSKETLYYSVEWRLITAGKARLSWNAHTQSRQEEWLARLHLESTGLVSKLFKVNDDYDTVLRRDLCAASSLMTAHEGRRHRETRVTFDGAARKAQYLEKDIQKNVVLLAHEIDIPPCVHDVVGGLYLLRTLPLDPGQTVLLPMSDGKKSVMARVEAQQREDLKTPSGNYKTIRYEAFIFNDVLYKRSAHLYVWLSDDRRRLPVQIRVRLQFTIGTITFQLEKMEQT
jgi:hypothetical protein